MESNNLYLQLLLNKLCIYEERFVNIETSVFLLRTQQASAGLAGPKATIFWIPLLFFDAWRVDCKNPAFESMCISLKDRCFEKRIMFWKKGIWFSMDLISGTLDTSFIKKWTLNAPKRWTVSKTKKRSE